MFADKYLLGDEDASRHERISEGASVLRQPDKGGSPSFLQMWQTTGEIAQQEGQVRAMPQMRSKPSIRQYPQTENIRSPTKTCANPRAQRKDRCCRKGKIQRPNQSAQLAGGKVIRTVFSGIQRIAERGNTEARRIPMPRVLQASERERGKTQRAPYRLRQEELRAREPHLTLWQVSPEDKLRTQGMDDVLRTKDEKISQVSWYW